jgi:hemerythrin-like domain-containing protein
VTLFDLLREQHREAASLLAVLREAQIDERPRLLARLASALRAHTAAEDEILYPKLEDDESEELLDQAYRDHEELREILADLEQADVSSAELGHLLDELEELQSRHTTIEEDEVFALLEERFDEAQLAGLSRQLAKRHEEILRGETRAHQPSA